MVQRLDTLTMRSIFYPFQKMRRIFFSALPLSIMLLFLFPASSQAHELHVAEAILLRSDPAQNAVLNSAPTRVRMEFSEDLNAGNCTAIVVNASKRRIDLGNAHISSTDAREMDVALQPLLSPGTYSVLWTTQSAADGSVLRGSFLFSVTEPNGTVPKTNGLLPGQPFSGSSSDLLTGPTLFNFIMVTLIDLGAIFWMGAQLWRTFVLQLTDTKRSQQEMIEQRAEVRFDRNFSLPLLLLLLLANIGIIVSQALLLTSGNLTQFFTLPSLISLGTSGRFGMYWMVREVVLLLALLLAVITLTIKNIPQAVRGLISWLNLILGMALLLVLTLTSHAAAANSDVLVYSVMLDWLHLLAASLWVGGMLYVSTIYLPVLKGKALVERVHSLVSTLPHYSLLAVTGVLILLVTGPFSASIHMSSFDQLTATAYGRTLIVKIVLVAALLITSGIHIGLLRPRLAKDYKRYQALVNEEQREFITVPESAGVDIQLVAQEEIKPLERNLERQSKRLTGVLNWEPALGVAVLICTGLLSVLAGTLQPVTANQAVPSPKAFTTTVKTSDKLFTLQLSVSPDRSGPNTFTISVFDSRGVKATNVRVSIYATMLEMDMGTNVITLQPDGKGNFSTTGNLDMGGRWGLRLEIRAPDLKLHTASITIVATG